LRFSPKDATYPNFPDVSRGSFLTDTRPNPGRLARAGTALINTEPVP
jgi:hypothetical protein